MSDNIIQRNEELIKHNLKALDTIDAMNLYEKYEFEECKVICMVCTDNV